MDESPELVAEIAHLVKENSEAQKRAAAQLNAFVANQEKINAAQAATIAAQAETNARAAGRTQGSVSFAG